MRIRVRAAFIGLTTAKNDQKRQQRDQKGAIADLVAVDGPAQAGKVGVPSDGSDDRGGDVFHLTSWVPGSR